MVESLESATGINAPVVWCQAIAFTASCNRMVYYIETAFEALEPDNSTCFCYTIDELAHSHV